MTKPVQFLEALSVIANVLQVANYEENLHQTTNQQLLKMLEYQNIEYLQKIINQNERIIELLEGKSNGQNA